MKQTPKLKIVVRSVKHVFTTDEIAQKNVDYRNSDKTVAALCSEADSIKSSYKAKINEATARKDKIGADLDAGFEHRDQKLAVLFDFKAGKKSFYLASLLEDGELVKGAVASLIEDVTDEDRQQDLIESEAKFERREDITMFEPAGDDFGILTVGRMGAKWFSALRVKIGTRVLEERLDSEQPASKKRPDQIKRTLKRFGEWLEENLGHEEAKGFKNQIALVQAEHAEREE